MTAQLERRGEDRVRFEFDVRAQRELGVLHAALSLVLLIAGGWLFALPYLLPRLVAAAGFAFAGLWLLRSARARREPAAVPALELGAEALHVWQAGSEQRVFWRDVESVAIDEDRLLVIVSRNGAPALELEPHYRGVGLHELGDSIQRALLAARTGQGCAPALDG